MKYGHGMPRPIAKDRTFHRIKYFCFGSRHAATVQHQEQQQEQHNNKKNNKKKKSSNQYGKNCYTNTLNLAYSATRRKRAR